MARRIFKAVSKNYEEIANLPQGVGGTVQRDGGAVQVIPTFGVALAELDAVGAPTGPLVTLTREEHNANYQEVTP